MASEFLNRLSVLNSYEVGDSFSIDDSRVDSPCAHCGSQLTNKVFEIEGEGYGLVCPYCLKPTVVWIDDKGKEHCAQTGQPSKAPMGTPANIAAAWYEGERCFHAGAYNAASMIYRKLIFLVAVHCGMPAKDKKDNAPDFTKCLDYLVKKGYISDRHRKTWADTIRLIGNNAAHGIKPIKDNEAKISRSFIRVILELVYEHEALAKKVRKG